MEKRAFIAGATGLVGGLLLERLLEDAQFAAVTVLTRRSLGRTDRKLREVVVEDFDAMEARLGNWDADCVLCCLGTTIKKAGSKTAFEKVDRDYPLRLAKLARSRGAKRFVLISALGADPKSRLFYNRVKGWVERDIASLGFEAFDIVRPSLILGERGESRWAEDLAKRLSPTLNRLLLGRWKKYRAIEARQVADAMARIAKSETTGLTVYESDALARLSSE